MSNRGSTNRNAESVYKPNLIDEKDENQQVAIGEKIPLFLVKLWNIVEDPAYYDIIRWDENGYSFHIMDPYSFCRNVLPQFFKHNNLNSLIRQLNMYGFRKITPIDRSSLARAESDQDHLEFSHPFFYRDHPELLVRIKRKPPLSKYNTAGNIPTQIEPEIAKVNTKELPSVFNELRQLKEKQKDMETRMNDLIKENEMVWSEMAHIRAAHLKQQQIVNKLIQLLVALVQPNKQQRIGKRHMYVLDDYPGHGKRGRMSSGTELESVADFSGNDSKITDQAGQIQLVQVSNANDALNYLINELSTRSDHGVAHPGALQQITHQPRSNSSNESGPIIAEVTDDLTDLSSEIMRHHSQQQTVVGLAQDTGNPSTTFLPRYPSYYPKYVDSVLEGGNTKYGQLNKQPAQHGISSVDGRHDDFTFTNTQVLDRKVNTTVGIPQQRMQPITEALSQVGVSPKNSQQLQPMGVSPIATQSPFSTTPLISSMQPQHSPSMQFRQNSSPEVRWENSPVERNISSNLTNSTSKNVPSSQNFQQNLNTRVATGEFANNTDFYLPEDWDSLLSDNNLAIDSIHNGIAQNWDSDSFNDLLDYTHDSEFVGEGGIQGHSSHGLNQHKI